ncbi:unnamed protein product [Lupinus luteus]|uniref:Inhibitor I9 domain-containing protein n=1 Tax=Lupinus luteus TaxID=3873 RepID=A0AAV1XUN3_LUPLU
MDAIMQARKCCGVKGERWGSHSFGRNPSLEDVESVTNFHYDLLGSFVGSIQKAKDAIFYSYNRHINGFAALLDEDEAAMVAKHSSVVSGLSLSEFGLPSRKLYSLVNAENAKADNANATDAFYCKHGALDHSKSKGKILVCHIYEDDPINQGVEVARVGGVGMILINDYSWFEVLPETHVLPAAHLNFTDGRHILNYINYTK